MYRPGNWPRCEAGFKTFCNLLHKRAKKFALISVFDDASVSNYYNKMKGYAADYYLNDTAGVCLKAFSFSNIPFDGSNVLKVTRQGCLITGGDYTVLGERFVEQLIDRRKPLDYHTYNATSPEDGNSAHPCIMADDTRVLLLAACCIQTASPCAKSAGHRCGKALR